jgi:pimeloyl-ACP methyl ester carboxylesterase
MSNAFDERAIRFGPDDRLVGIVTAPAQRDARLPGVIVLTAGLVQRSGPFRLHVDLARALAAIGCPALRFDQTGVGESLPGQDTAAEQRVADIRAAIDALARETGATSCVLFGICSGADDTLHVAPDEPRIAGGVLLDGPAWPDFGHRVRHYLPRLLSFEKWRARFTRREPVPDGVIEFRDFPPRAELPARIARLRARGMRFLFVYTGGAYAYFNHRGQLASNYGVRGGEPGVALAFWPDSDHTYFSPDDRTRLVATVVAWVGAEFGRASAR